MKKISLYHIIKKNSILDIVEKEGFTYLSVDGAFIIKSKDLESTYNKATIKKIRDHVSTVGRSDGLIEARKIKLIEMYDLYNKELDSNKLIDTGFLKNSHDTLINIFTTGSEFKYFNNKFIKLIGDIKDYTIQTKEAFNQPVLLKSRMDSIEFLIIPMRITNNHFEISKK